MEVRAVSKYNRISARKTRLIADMVRGRNVGEAFEALRFTPKKAARLVSKTLKSAVSNAENNFHLDKKDLVISKITVDEGPTLKRFRPRAKGAAGPIKKRTAHVTVVVEDIKKDKKVAGKVEKVVKEKVTKTTEKVEDKQKLEQKNGS